MCVEKDILATLAYFDIFDYPLNKEEICRFLPQAYSNKLFEDGLNQLRKENWIFQFDELFALHSDYSLITRRRQGNAKAKKLLKTAEKIAAFLSHFPFVRGVAVSGSLSKHFADERSDIDFFIITEKNKLWIARTFMHFFKKLSFLINKQHWFCMNYYVDNEVMQIKEKNRYTAIELVTIIPYSGKSDFQEFYTQNMWSKQFLPNHPGFSLPERNAGNSFFKKMIESVFCHSFGEKLDRYLMRLTADRWAKKTERKQLNGRGIIMGIDVSRHYAKPDPRHFQIKLVDQYEKKVSELLHRYEERNTIVLSEKTA